MWLDRYNAMTTLDKDRFSSLANELLNKNYILAYTYDKNRIRKINSNYNFIVRYFDVFEGYFALSNYDVTRDNDLEVISIVNSYGYNHARIDRMSTLFLFTLRLIYNEAREMATTSSAVFTTTGIIIQKMIELGLVPKKPTIKDTVEMLRFALGHNIIQRLDKTIDNFDAQLVILPSILLAVSNEKINMIYQIMFNRDTEGEENETIKTNSVN